MDEPLGRGAVGAAVAREEAGERKKVEEEQRAEERAKIEKARKKAGKGKEVAKQYYEPGHMEKGADGGTARASTPGTGRAVIMDYRSRSQKRFHSRCDY